MPKRNYPKTIFLCCFLISTFFLAGNLRAQGEPFYKGKTVRLIVGLSPGGFYDRWARLLARYMFPEEIGLSGNVRYQSGWPWAPIHRVNIPGSGTLPIYLENVDQNRSESVTIVDVRVEKGFSLGPGRLTGMLDIYNLFNSNSEVNFNLRTGTRFRNIIAALDPRAFKIGIRYQF